MNFLYPKIYERTVHDIDYDKLYIEGYRGIMFDIDNTLAPYDRAKPDTKTVDLIRRLKRMGFEVCLVSNNNQKRVFKFNEPLKLHAYPRAKKPLTRNLKRAMHKMGTEPKTTVFVGDQLFTDVWAGNVIGFKTALVKPIQDKEQMITKVKRGLEGVVLNRFLKKKGISRFK